MKVSYYLKRNPDQKSALIVLQMRWPKKELRYSTRRSLSKEDTQFWDMDQQRINDNNTEANESGLVLYNDYLDRLAKLAKRTWMELQAKGPLPEPADIKKVLDEFTGAQSKELLNTTDSFYDLLDDYCDGKIKKVGDDEAMKPNSIKGYVTVRGHLLEFDKQKRYGFDSINTDWRNKYKEFLEGKSLGIGSIRFDFDKIGAILHEAYSRKLSTNMIYLDKRFKPRKKKKEDEESDRIFLNPTQIDKLYHHRFEDPKIELIKDYLCLATQTGLRYSDWHKIKFENMIQAKGEWFLDIKKTQKDKKGLRLLCSPLVLEIFKKYRNKLPTVPKYDIVLPGVKVACGILADINASEVGSHIGRRSLATNMYIADPDSIETIRRILGHTSQDMTRKYIQTGLDDMGRMQVEHRDKRKLRIVK